MIERYRNSRIEEIWSDRNKTNLWEWVELAVLKVQTMLKLIKKKDQRAIEDTLLQKEINLNWWKKRDKEIHHDLNAFVDERKRHLPKASRRYFHKGMTSYDTEEPAFAKMISDSLDEVYDLVKNLDDRLVKLALRYRFTFMLARTHGQGAELQTFGKRCLTWLQELRLTVANLQAAAYLLQYSKLSGAIGNYSNLDPVIEEKTLVILGLKPFHGATQIMPRFIYSLVADGLCSLVLELHKIALDIRLGARSPRPIFQEPFGTLQKGSSAMPHKRNPTGSEQIEGMARMALAKSLAIKLNISTWEERAIEQSCVERVEWPDLFHIAVNSLRVMNHVLGGLKVYPDNMMWEIIESRGCYASSEAYTAIQDMGTEFGPDSEEAYRIIQLAAANVMEPSPEAVKVRQNPPSSIEEAWAAVFSEPPPPEKALSTIRELISHGELRVSSGLAASHADVERWNKILQQIFEKEKNRKRWDEIFSPSYLLRNEPKLYQEILGE